MTLSKSKKGNNSKGEVSQDGFFRISFATLEDVKSLVDLHYKCFTKKDHIAMRFGKSFILATYKWFVTSPQEFVVIAKHGDSLIGFQSVSERSYDAPMLRASLREALTGLIFHPWLAFHPELLTRLLRLLFRQHKESIDSARVAQLAFIGVDPQVQGKGIGKALVRAAVSACRERGMEAITTGVLRQNLRSKAMLESAGFIEIPGLGTKRFIHLRMDLDTDV
jgi:ribosomal protein S18 acetylase RimI-like enzyme